MTSPCERIPTEASAWTWTQLRERVDTLAAGLSRLGVRRGDRSRC